MDLAWAVTPRPILIHNIPSMLPYSIGIQLETVNGCGHGLGTVSWVEIIIVVLYLIPPFYHCAAFVQEIRLAVNGKPAALDHGPFRPPIIGVQVSKKV